MKATINDVARHAGVSKATVSRVINGHQNVAKPLRERVEQSIRDLQFQPCAVARDLSVGRTKILGVIVPDMSGEYYAMILKGMEERASQNDYLIIPRNSDAFSKQNSDSVARLIRQNVAGIAIIFGLEHEIQNHAFEGIPVPVVQCNYSNELHNSVYIEKSMMMKHALNYLLALGHSHICYISSKNTRSAEIENTYRLMMLQSGLTHLAITDLSSFESICFSAQRTIVESQPTAFIASDAETAFAVYDAVRRMGISIPEDVSILSLSGIENSPRANAFLTTISIPAYDMGVAAIDILLSQIHGEIENPVQRIMRTTLHTNGSCASVRSGATDWESFASDKNADKQ